VGDYLFDLLSAKAAGAAAVLLASHNQAEEFVEHADFCIKDIGEILEIVTNSNST
jgi:phosphoglycolate phosphatase-like HAD superfamily hydrolase